MSCRATAPPRQPDLHNQELRLIATDFRQIRCPADTGQRAGYVLGAAWVASMVALFNLWRRESGQPAVDPVRGLEPEKAGRLDPRSSGSEAA
jgi:hypothetical protein